MRIVTVLKMLATPRPAGPRTFRTAHGIAPSFVRSRALQVIR
jgi:hypothetical protein